MVVADWSPGSRCLVCWLLMFAGFYITYAFMCHVSCTFFYCWVKVIFNGRDNKVKCKVESKLAQEEDVLQLWPLFWEAIWNIVWIQMSISYADLASVCPEGCLNPQFIKSALSVTDVDSVYRFCLGCRLHHALFRANPHIENNLFLIFYRLNN